jgi:hypothetical protein
MARIAAINALAETERTRSDGLTFRSAVPASVWLNIMTPPVFGLLAGMRVGCTGWVQPKTGRVQSKEQT